MHTTGPWNEASTGNHQALVISETTGDNIAVVYDKRNARLIAAAPELLAAVFEAKEFVRRLLDAEDQETGHDLIVNNACIDVETDLIAAIAKATGKE